MLAQAVGLEGCPFAKHTCIDCAQLRPLRNRGKRDIAAARSSIDIPNKDQTPGIARREKARTVWAPGYLHRIR